MSSRVQVILSDEDREAFRLQAEREGVSLSAWLRDAGRRRLDAAWTLAHSLTSVWHVEPDDVAHARALVTAHGGLGARDLLHLACCQRRRVDHVKTFDAALADAWAN